MLSNYFVVFVGVKQSIIGAHLGQNINIMDLLDNFKNLLANREKAYYEAISARNLDNERNMEYIRLLHDQNTILSRGQMSSTFSTSSPSVDKPTVDLSAPTTFLVDGDLRFYVVGGKLLILKKVLLSAGIKEKVLRPYLFTLTRQVKEYLCNWSKNSPENGEVLKSSYAWVNVTNALQEELVTLNFPMLVPKIQSALVRHELRQFTPNSSIKTKDTSFSDMDLDTMDSCDQFFQVLI